MGQDTLLIVDDECADVMACYFSHRGFVVHTATDGREAIELAAKLSPDLVLLDINLPVIDGFEVLEELKKREIQTRVVMFSAYFNDRNTAIRCIRNGACDFIDKLELDPSEIADRIRKYILLEKTLNVRVADTTPIVDKLIRRTEELTTQLDEIANENALLRSRNLKREVAAKSVYVLLALLGVSVLFKVGVVAAGLSLGLLFLVLVLLLMIPMDRIQRVSAEFSRLKTRLTLGVGKSPTSASNTTARKPRRG